LGRENKYMDYAKGDAHYFIDVNKNRLFTRNNQNYINRLGRDVLNTLGNVSLLEIYLSRGQVIQPTIQTDINIIVLNRNSLSFGRRGCSYLKYQKYWYMTKFIAAASVNPLHFLIDPSGYMHPAPANKHAGLFQVSPLIHRQTQSDKYCFPG